MSNVELLARPIASAFYGRFTALRPAQEAAIPPLIDGENVVLSSGTGSGKTEAVMAPLVSRYYRDAVEAEQPVILYIAPTKALANDLEKRLFTPLDQLHLRVGIRHGDRDDLIRGQPPHVLITTPESLDVLLFRKDRALDMLRCVVIDEVHLLYNTQRGLHLSILLRRLRDRLGREMQWAALSATVGRLSDIRDFLVGPEEPATLLQYPAHREIDACVRHVTSEGRFLDLMRRLAAGSPTKLLIFANSRRDCERLADVLQRDDELCRCTFAHYSSLAPEVRVETEARFASLRTAICIATSTLELGIDIGDIDAVVLWGVPASVESFLQRIGRGNRQSSKTKVICLIPYDTPDDTLTALRFVALIDAAREGAIPVRTPYDLFGAAAQQCLNVIASEGGRYMRVADLCSYTRHKDYLDRSTMDSILADLADSNYLQRHGYKNRYGACDKLHRLVDYRMIYGNFPVESEKVEVRYGSKPLGVVPSINLLRLRVGDVVRFASRQWRICGLSLRGILVEPVEQQRHAVDFKYMGNAPGFDAFLTDRLWTILIGADAPYAVLGSTMRDRVIQLRDSLIKASDRGVIPCSRASRGVTYLTFAGSLVNRAIALITRQPEYDAGDIALTVTESIQWDTIPTDPQEYESVFPLLFEPSVSQTLFQTLLPHPLQLREFIQDWLRDEAIHLVLARLATSIALTVDASIVKTLTAPLGEK